MKADCNRVLPPCVRCSCLLGEGRSASVVAEDYCELYSLSRQDLDKVRMLSSAPPPVAAFCKL